MSRFLKFRGWCGEGHSRVDRNHIISASVEDHGDDTTIRLTGGASIYVKESPDEVIAAIEAAEAEDRAADEVAEAIRGGELSGSSEPGAAPEAEPIPLRVGQVWEGMAGTILHRSEVLAVGGDGVRRRVIEGASPGQDCTITEADFRRFYTRLVSDAPEPAPEPIPVRPMQVRRNDGGEVVLVLEVRDKDAMIVGGNVRGRYEVKVNGRLCLRTIGLVWPEVIHEEAE